MRQRIKISFCCIKCSKYEKNKVTKLKEMVKIIFTLVVFTLVLKKNRVIY